MTDYSEYKACNHIRLQHWIRIHREDVKLVLLGLAAYAITMALGYLVFGIR